MTYSYLPELRRTQDSKLKAVLDRSTDLSLTTDIWTDRRSHAFLAVTVHGFDDGFPFSYLLSFKSFDGSHTGSRIAEALETIISENHISSKVRSVVSDNASNMRKAMSVLISTVNADASEIEGTEIDDPSLWEDEPDVDVIAIIGNNNTIEHLACFAHSLQLVVHDGLASMSSARPFIAKCCKIANLVHQSALFRGNFEKAFGTGRSIPSTNDTRWNSTFTQLTAFSLLDQSTLSKLLKETNHDGLIISTKEFNQLLELVKILSPFAEATDLTQGDTMVTISCVVPTILSLSNSLVSSLQSPSFFTTVLKTLQQSLQDRFIGIFNLLGIKTISTRNSHSKDLKFNSKVFLMATALDPSFAFHWLQDHPGTTEQKEAIRHQVNG